jgi:ATP-binding cassette, subfamily B, bacterial
MTKTSIKSLLNKYKFYLIGLIILSILANITNLMVPKLIGQLVDRVSSNNTSVADTTLYYTIAALIIGGFIMALCELMFSIWFSEKFAKDLKIASFNNLTKQPYQYVINQGSAKIITVFGSDIDNIQENFTSSISYIFQAVVLLLGALVLMITTSWKLTIIAVIALPVIVIGFFFMFSKIGKFFQLSQTNLTELNNTIGENINSANLVRVLASTNWEERKYFNFNNQSKSISLNIVKAFSFLLPFINLISNIVTVAFLYFGARIVTTGELTVGALTAFLGYFALLITPIFILGFTSQGISQALASWKRVEPILNADGKEIVGTYNPDKIQGDIEVKNINLEFGGKKVLDSISFTIKKGQKTAILGPTGAGKSQLLNILLGLAKPTTGEVFIDGHKITDWNQNTLLNHAGIVFQESLVFNTTFRHNIDMDRGIEDIAITKAVNTSQLQDYVKNLTNGYDTSILAKGANLSGGQKQRLTLARALASSPDILLLDDFTARVDGNTEKLIRDAIYTNYPNTQIIQVCQKIDSIKDYDNIIVIMEGQLLAQGTHEELLKNSAEYNQIYKSQQTV